MLDLILSTKVRKFLKHLLQNILVKTRPKPKQLRSILSDLI